MKFDQAALQLWDKKYGEHNKKGDFDSDVSANFKSRLSSHIIKTAITVSISESDSLIITEPQLRRAIELIEDVRDQVDIVFRSVGESPLAVAQERVIEFIKIKGIVSREEILRYNFRHMTDEQLTQVMFTLLHSGMVSEYSQAHKTAYQWMNIA